MAFVAVPRSSSFSRSVAAVCAQRLLPAIDPKISRVPATEVLLAEPAVVDKIREGEDEDLPSIIIGSKESGMHNFTMSLARLIREGYVYTDTAMEYAPNREQLIGSIRGIETAAQTLVHRVKRSGNI